MTSHKGARYGVHADYAMTSRYGSVFYDLLCYATTSYVMAIPLPLSLSLSLSPSLSVNKHVYTHTHHNIIDHGHAHVERIRRGQRVSPVAQVRQQGLGELRHRRRQRAPEAERRGPSRPRPAPDARSGPTSRPPPRCGGVRPFETRARASAERGAPSLVAARNFARLTGPSKQQLDLPDNAGLAHVKSQATSLGPTAS